MSLNHRSILDELNSIVSERDKLNVIESRGNHIIKSALNLIELIQENFDENEALDLQRRLINSIKGNIRKYTIDQITSKCINDLALHNIVFDKHIVATLQTVYKREYYETHNGIRITIDQDLEFLDTQLYTVIDENNSYPYPLKIMEIKFKPTMKDIVSDLIRPLHITPKRHSKYLIGLAKLGNVVYM